MTSSSDNDSNSSFPTVGRDSRANLAKYTVQVLGREIIDYDKIRSEDPELYAEIVGDEREADRKHQEELDEILAGPSTPSESVLSFAAVESPQPESTFICQFLHQTHGRTLTTRNTKSICLHTQTIQEDRWNMPPGYFLARR